MTVSVVLLILLVVAAIVLNNRFNGVARFRAWKVENEDALMTVFECLTIAVVTMQTLVMVTASHEEVGGSSPPPLFDDVMKFFSFCSFDIINDFLPGQFIPFNLSTPRPPSLPRYSTHHPLPYYPATIPGMTCLPEMSTRYQFKLYFETGAFLFFSVCMLCAWWRRRIVEQRAETAASSSTSSSTPSSLSTSDTSALGIEAPAEVHFDPARASSNPVGASSDVNSTAVVSLPVLPRVSFATETDMGAAEMVGESGRESGRASLTEVEKEAAARPAWKVLRWLVWCTKIMLPAITLTISKAWRCVQYEDESLNLLLADMSLSCDSREYKIMITYASLMALIFPVGVPIFWLIHLHRIKGHLDPASYELEVDEVQNVDRGSASSVGGRMSRFGRSRRSGGSRRRPLNHGVQKVEIDLDDDVLATSPLEPLFSGLDPRYAWWYDIADMMRRIAVKVCLTRPSSNVLRTNFELEFDLILWNFTILLV